jgi:hypothetical protein
MYNMVVSIRPQSRGEGNVYTFEQENQKSKEKKIFSLSSFFIFFYFFFTYFLWSL